MSSSTKIVRRWLWILIAFATVSHLWGIRKDLPFTHENDEFTFVFVAIRMAATGDLNPGWFGNPGSTVIYPLALLSHLWNAAAHGGHVFSPDLNLFQSYRNHSHEFYLLGRLLCSAYGIGSIALVFLVGIRVFGIKTGLMGAWLYAALPVPVTHAQTIRTDSAAVCFGILSLLLILRARRSPTRQTWIPAGLAVGLAMASRYFMAALLAPLVLCALHARSTDGKKDHWMAYTILALGVVLIGFALSTPYFFLDFNRAMASIRYEGRSVHLGADGGSPFENICYYLTQGFPNTLTLPLALLSAAGMLLAFRRWHPAKSLLLAYWLLFMAGISILSLHWDRWLIQLLPIHALFAASVIRKVSTNLRGHRYPGLGTVLFFLIWAWPLSQLVRQNIQQTNASTRIQARVWIHEHVPKGSLIAEEWYTAPLRNDPYRVDERFSLSETDLAHYRKTGYQYLITSSYIEGRYRAEPQRYGKEIHFYDTLAVEGTLIHNFEPSWFTGGPRIKIFYMDKNKSESAPARPP